MRNLIISQNRKTMESFITFISLVGIVISLLTVGINKGYKKANLYLGGYLFFSSCFTLAIVVGIYYSTQYEISLPALSALPCFFLIGPFAFLYVRSILRNDPHPEKYDYLHFLLFLIQLAGMFPWYVSSVAYKSGLVFVLLSDQWDLSQVNLSLIPSTVNFIIRPLHLFFYLGWILIMIYRKHIFSPENLLRKPVNNVVTKYLLIFICFVSYQLICIIHITFDHFKYPTRSDFLSHSMIFLLIWGVVLVIFNLVLLLFPTILYGLSWDTHQKNPRRKNTLACSTWEAVEAPVHDGIILTDNSRDQQEIEVKLRDEVGLNKPFLEQNFTIYSLAVTMEIPEYKLRAYFHHTGVSFSEYRNRLRVEHAISMLQAGDSDRYSIEGIGKMSGFSSTASFFTEFRKATGKSPMLYARNYKTGTGSPLS